MGEGNGAGKSSGAESQPLKPAAAKSSRPVFISYASHDAAVAQKVCSALEAAGFPCWIAPRNVVPGTMYADGIVHAIDESSILVLILSAQAVASAHVGREIERAVSKRHPVVALRIDGAPLTAAFEYFLNQSQWIEGGGSDAAIEQLVAAVGQHLSPGSATSLTNGIQASAGDRKVATPRQVWVIAVVVIAVVLAGAYFFVDKARHSKHERPVSTAVISDKSIAVLPFTDMSEKKDQEYFADGMAEEIQNILAKLPQLRVLGRASSFQFKGSTEDVRTVASKLGAAYVVSGGVSKAGSRIRVTAQLIDAKSGAQLWSERYDREFNDILVLQDEIATAIACALRVTVSARDARPLGEAREAEAYTLYQKGKLALDSFDTNSLAEAQSNFEQALVLMHLSP